MLPIRAYAKIRDWTVATAIGLAYFLAAYYSLFLTQGVDGIATIWPASGVFVAALLLTRRAIRLPIIIAVAAASLASNILFGAAAWMALGFTLANIAEALVVCYLVTRFSDANRMLDDMRSLVVFFGAALVGALVSGTFASVLTGETAPTFLVSWITTVGLGTLIVTPPIVAITRSLANPKFRLLGRGTAGLLLSMWLIGLVSTAIFVLGVEQLLFLPVIGVVIAAYLYGASGAALGIAVTSIIATFGTDFATSTDDFLGMDGDTLLLQFYLLGLLVAAWPLTALIADKERLIGQYADTNRFLELAESTAHVGHWYLAADGAALVWSAEVYRIHGIEPGTFDAETPRDLSESSSLDLYHPDDRERVRVALLEAMENQQGFEYEARIIRPDGPQRIISTFGLPRFDKNGGFEGLFGTFQDITDQTETLEALEFARTTALREAATSKRLSETDELTGIANRRKVLAQVEAANRRARRKGKPVSLAILDIDRFKLINDRFGHHTGDEVIKRIAALVSGELRDTDHVGRLGGEEFLVVLPGEDSAGAHAIIERVRLRIAAEQWSAAGPEQVTLSAGLVTIAGGDDFEAALRRADEALYEAKHDGRNALRSAA